MGIWNIEILSIIAGSLWTGVFTAGRLEWQVSVKDPRQNISRGAPSWQKRVRSVCCCLLLLTMIGSSFPVLWKYIMSPARQCLIESDAALCCLDVIYIPSERHRQSWASTSNSLRIWLFKVSSQSRSLVIGALSFFLSTKDKLVS